MCRLLAIKAERTFQISKYLKKFAVIAKSSKEFQGHGWGCAYLNKKGVWKYYKNIKSIWEDDFRQFPEATMLIAHARSAFQDKGIIVKNNMPFYDKKFIFIFNGELRGVKIKARGRIGAEKIFNYIKQSNMDGKKSANGGIEEMIKKRLAQIQKRTGYVRALNIIIVEKETNNIYATNIYNEDPDYFQMYWKKSNEMEIICSNLFPKEENWQKMPTNRVIVL